MSAVRPSLGNPQPVHVPTLLVELPSFRRVFFGNLRDLIRPRRLDPLELRSAPASFWPDVFVRRSLPWDGLLQSGAYHLIALGLLMGVSRLLALQPRVAAQPVFDHSQVVYYQPSEYLPPLDTRSDSAAPAKKADPVFSRQPIISVPREADNHSQTIVTPPKVRLKREVAMPNIVAWSDDVRKPRLDIPPAPLTPAAELTRIAPTLENSVVTPPPDAARLSHRRNSVVLQNSVVAPPPEVRAANAASFQGLQPALIAPPPTVEASPARPLGDMNIAPSTVIAPAPQLPVAAQRTVPGGMSGPAGIAPQIVPPPPSLSASGSAAGSFGSPGRVIALNLHPAVGAPPDPPAGNRRGTFAASPDGHPGSSGSPGSASASASSGAAAGNGDTRKGTSDLPAGLYVGSITTKPSAVAGTTNGGSSSSSVNPSLIASVSPPRVSSDRRPMQPADASKLSEAERTVFGNRRFYSVTLNMPNLNSAGGSWVIRFAELNHESSSHDASAPAPDLSQPMATRKVDPAYPIQLMRENVAGTVILYAVIHADGSVGNVRVLRGVDERLDRFASEAVAQWKFDPATKNGAPVDVEATFQIPFRPARVGTNF
jgi:TonB family protein